MAAVNYRWKDDYAVNASAGGPKHYSADPLIQDAYGILDASVNFETENWRVSFFGKNLTDEDAVPMTTRWLQVPYFTFASVAVGSNIPGADTGTPRAFFGALRRERQLGLELTYNF